VNSSVLQVSIALAQAVALLMSVAFISYALIIVAPYLRYRPAQAGDARTLAWHLFVPALDEERVIGATIDYLRATFPRAHVWMIDDDSENDTASIVGMRAWADPMVHLVRRYRPAARTGKGDALNSAYLALDQWLPATADSARTIIGVIDADGRPAANCLDVCASAGMFGDPVVGSIQIQVRMLECVGDPLAGQAVAEGAGDRFEVLPESRVADEPPPEFADAGTGLDQVRETGVDGFRPSVEFLITMSGRLRAVHSSWTPPESDTMRRACRARPKKVRWWAGGMIWSRRARV
jgi:hypothetical protein